MHPLKGSRAGQWSVRVSGSDRRAAVLELAQRESRHCGGVLARPVSKYEPNKKEYKELRAASMKTRDNANCIDYVAAELRQNKALHMADTAKKSNLQDASINARDTYDEIKRQFSASKLTFDDAIAKAVAIATTHREAVVTAIEEQRQVIAAALAERGRAELVAWANPVDAPQRRIPNVSDEKSLATVRTVIGFERQYCKSPGSKIGTKSKL